MLKNVSLGSDPEFFLKDGDKFVTAIGKLGGTKRRPKLLCKDPKIYIQEDNVMGEFNTPPVSTKNDFRNVVNTAKSIIAKHCPTDIAFVPSATFDPKDLEHKQAKISGCEPHWNVYTEELEHVNVAVSNLRSAGGHIHIGYDNAKDNIVLGAKLIKALDLFVGVPSIYMDQDTHRRKLYGKPGVFRFKEYGVEYRSPSNFWLQNDALIDWVYDSVHKAINFVNAGKTLSDTEEIIIQETINYSDYEAAEMLMREYMLDKVEHAYVPPKMEIKELLYEV